MLGKWNCLHECYSKYLLIVALVSQGHLNNTMLAPPNNGGGGVAKGLIPIKI